MPLNRRSFLGTAVSGAALAASGGLFSSFKGESSSGKKLSSILKISCQEGVAPGNTLIEKLDFMESLGIVGLEVGGRDLGKRVSEIQQALQNRNMKMSAICAGFDGWLIADDPAIQKKCMDSLKVIIAAAGELGSTGVIFVPAFNNQKSLPDKEARELLIGQMKELGDYALQNKTRILLEPLNREECYFCRQVADGAAIVRDV
jgi:sugar phosphate isomerase/epimerase